MNRRQESQPIKKTLKVCVQAEICLGQLDHSFCSVWEDTTQHQYILSNYLPELEAVDAGLDARVSALEENSGGSSSNGTAFFQPIPSKEKDRKHKLQKHFMMLHFLRSSATRHFLLM